MGAGSLAEGWGNGKASAVAYARAGATVVCADYHLGLPVFLFWAAWDGHFVPQP